MDADKQAQIQAHARAIAALLYDETAPEHLTTLEGIEGESLTIALLQDEILLHTQPVD